jgi:hypothetical protein
VGDLDMALSGYLFDGTSGWTGTGLKSNNVGFAKGSDSTKFGMMKKGSSFTVLVHATLTNGAANANFLSSAPDNSGIQNGTPVATTYGRFQFTSSNVGATSKHPSVTVKTAAGYDYIKRDDASTAASTLVNDTPSVQALTYDEASHMGSLYLNGNLNKSLVVNAPLKFDNLVVNSGQQIVYSVLVYNRVLTSGEIASVSNELLV